MYFSNVYVFTSMHSMSMQLTRRNNVTTVSRANSYCKFMHSYPLSKGMRESQMLTLENRANKMLH